VDAIETVKTDEKGKTVEAQTTEVFHKGPTPPRGKKPAKKRETCGLRVQGEKILE